jgi:hypothetical protein
MRHPYAFLIASLVLAGPGAAQNLKPVLLPTMSGEKIGYQNAAGQTVIKPRFDEGNTFEHGLAVVGVAGKFGMIDSTGQEVLPLKYRVLADFHDGLAGASLDGQKYGFVNRTGAFVIAPVYTGVADFSERRAVVVQGNKCALLNTKGTLLTLFKYQGIENVQGGIARVCLKNTNRDDIEFSNTWGFIDANGREISKLNNHGYHTKNLGNGYAIACYELPEALKTQHVQYASALLDKTGRAVIPFAAGYNFDSWTDTYLQVRKGFPAGVVDYTGKVVLAPNFWKFSDFVYGEDGKSLAKAFTSQNDFFYVDHQYRCVEYGRVKCPEY